MKLWPWSWWTSTWQTRSLNFWSGVPPCLEVLTSGLLYVPEAESGGPARYLLDEKLHLLRLEGPFLVTVVHCPRCGLRDLGGYSGTQGATPRRSEVQGLQVHQKSTSLRRAREIHGYKQIRLGHVRAHTGEHGNEYVDNLATQGLHATETCESGPARLLLFAGTNAPT